MSAPANVSASRLAETVGPEHFACDAETFAAYQVDGVMPSVAVRPGSIEEVAEIVRVAAAEKLALIASGARTKLGIGLPPSRYDVAVDMSRMNRIVAYDPGDLTLSVEAGCTLGTVLGALGEQRQFLPLAVPYLRRATIGGTLASGIDSPLRQFFGTARDYTLGMEFVGGDGNPMKSGGRVVKNVSGYDLHKLMIGAIGTLGIITRVNFRTYPVPASSRAFVAAFSRSNGAFGLRDRISQAALPLSTLEVFSPGTAALFSSEAASRAESAPLAAGVLSDREWTVTAEFAGVDVVLDRVERELRQLAEAAGADRVAVLASDQIAGAFGRKREFVPIALGSSPATVILKISVLPWRMNDVISQSGRAADENRLAWVAMARGVGAIYFAMMPGSRDEDARRRTAAAANKILSAAQSLEGHATIPWCPSEWKASLPVWGLARADFPQMRKLKALFDPQGIFAPGRFVGGL